MTAVVIHESIRGTGMGQVIGPSRLRRDRDAVAESSAPW